MFDGLLGRGFSSKCKLLIKPTRTRIDVLRKRQEATQRFLKGNLAQLLANGLDINAYGRTEEFIAGQNVLSCYDFIERCCEYILKQLSLMQKQRECPEECRESIGSLMFAAARFPDMPELRDLRDLFQERYGTGLEHFVNHDFVEKIASKSSTTEKKLQFLQGIALEFSIKWDCRDFQRSKLDPSTSSRDQPKRSNGKDTISNPEKIINARKEYNHLNHDRNGIDGAKNKNVLKKEADKPDNYHHHHHHSNALPPPYVKPIENKHIDAPEPEKLMNRRYREKGLTYYDEVPLPKPRSMRKKHSSQNCEEDANNVSSSRSRRKDTNNSSGRGLQILFEDEHQQKDEEERVIDKLLLHYSSKPSNFDPEKLIRKPNNAETRNNNPALIPPPATRSISLPREKTTSGVEPVKVYARANSIQPAKHVHPKLPDYDDLAARFAALKDNKR
ncbi:uncharacterized protein LOC124915442 [Impatiens glandulifera]|uniref:uncharacterized protein LOC124915442 n=1 Tax=Impatiens glandulifera TaxID=253017 RepID=UPI001FB168B1|nr:uncharacterized protein LOC124915442 [Impatiens glandulifera]